VPRRAWSEVWQTDVGSQPSSDSPKLERRAEAQSGSGAMMEYFAPLKAWLDVQNKGKPSGWSAFSGDGNSRSFTPLSL